MSKSLNSIKKENGENFEQCSICEKSLIKDLFFVEKAYQRNLNGEGFFILFEFAICQTCKQELGLQLSKESFQKMQNYLLAHQAQIQKNTQKESAEICSFSGRELSGGEAFHQVFMIQNGTPLGAPISMSDVIMEEYQALLSEKTKDFFEEFYHEYIDVPPAMARLLNPKQKTVLL